MTHELKTVQPYFGKIWQCDKGFEVRKNDRDFQTGDFVLLREYDATAATFSGRELLCRISYVLYDHPGLVAGHCCFGLDVQGWIGAE